METDLSLATLVRIVSVWKHTKPDWKISKTDKRGKVGVFHSIIKDFRKNEKENNGQKIEMGKKNWGGYLRNVEPRIQSLKDIQEISIGL